MIDSTAFNDQNSVKNSPLTGLPVELRIRIMEHLLLEQPKLLATIHHYRQESAAETTTTTTPTTSTRTISPPSRIYHPLHVTCKSLHHEFSKIQLEQATHVFHQPRAQNGLQDSHWFKTTATHPIRHIKVVVEYHDEQQKAKDVVESINDAFTLLYPSYRNTFPEAQNIDFVHVFRNGWDKAMTGITPHQYQHTLSIPFSTSSRFDFWVKTEETPADGISGGAMGNGGGVMGTGGEEKGVLSINNLHLLPTLFPQMERFDIDWTVTHTSALGRLRFQARNIARLISEAMKGFVDLGRNEGEQRKRATLQLRSINSDYGGTTQDLDFDTDRNM